ncbi:DUF6416 domain-containing protein [Streptomyces sp. TR02-1]|uniref:DUF6416 domain-containing protein n=1 Tax=Streptomyces sp. TR02-1 TaxID=3385977 RepID=UPI0039A36C63
MIKLNLGSGAELTLSKSQALHVAEQLNLALRQVDEPGASPSSYSTPRVLGDDHPMWNAHSGGGRDIQEWDAESDLQLAEWYYNAVTPKVRFFLDLLMDHPGQRLDADEICERSAGRFSGRPSLSGSLKGLAKQHEKANRNYPFYWWEDAPGKPSWYAMKPSVARLFQQARGRD